MIAAKGEFGKWLAKKIIDEEVTVVDFADRIGLHKSTVWSHIRCRAHPYMYTIKIYADYFHEPMDQLIDLVILDKKRKVRG